MYNVTVSVWNKFWSLHLIDGFIRSGFNVEALGTSRAAPERTSYRCCWPSAIATQIGHRFPNQRDRYFRYALANYEKFAARQSFNTRCFWGWSNHHLAAFKRAKAEGIPIVLECGSTHTKWSQRIISNEYHKYGKSMKNGLFNELLPSIFAEYELADRICVPSRFVANTFVECGIPVEKLYLNPYGADINFWRQCKPRSSLNKLPFVFVYTAQIMLRKGVYYLLDSWKQLSHPSAELWMIGGVHPDCSDLMKTLPANVRFLGGKTHNEILALYAQADVFILPSLEEGLARSVLEAMAAGLPVIITEETGASDVMVDGEDGWLIPSRDSTALVSAFCEAFSDRRDTCARGESARQRVSPFSWSAYGDRAAVLLADTQRAT